MLILLLCSYCISSHVCLDMGKCDGGSRVETSFTVLLFEPGRSAFVLYVLWKVWFGPPLAVSSAKNPTSKHMRCKHWRHIICKRSRCAPSHLSLPAIPNKRSCQRARVCSMSFLFLFFCLSLFSFSFSLILFSLSLLSLSLLFSDLSVSLSLLSPFSLASTGGT